MVWLERPPLLRWLAAALFLAVTAWMEFAPGPEVSMVVLAQDVPAGTRLAEEHVDRVGVRASPFETVAPAGVAAVDLQAGDPLVASMITDVSVPRGWAAIEAPVPARASAGSWATVVTIDDSGATDEFTGLVVEGASSDPFGATVGLVAIPPERLAAALVASSQSRLHIGLVGADR